MADATIDKVQIEIEANAQSASKELEKLSQSLSSVKRNLTGFDTSSLERFQKTLESVEAKAKSVSNVSVKPKVDTSNISGAEKKISRSLENVQDKFARLGSLANAAMGGDSSALTSFSRKATSLQGDIDVVSEKLKRLGDTRVSSEAFTNLESKIDATKTKLQTLQADFSKVKSGEAQLSDDAFVRLKQSISDTRNELDTLINKQQQMIQDGSAYDDPFQTYRDGLAQTQASLDSLISKVQEATNAGSGGEVVPPTDDGVSKLELLKGKVIETTNSLVKMGGAGIVNGIKKLGDAFKKIHSKASEAGKGVSKLHGFLDKGFMKVLKYGFGIRSLYVGFRRLRKGVVESFGELQKSGAFFTTTKSNLEGLKASLATLKFQFGAAFEPIFNAVAPALQTFINYIVQAMNVFSAFTAKLMGKDTYSRAVSSSSKVAGNVGGAAKAAKELNKQLQGFDELNNLSSNDGGSGGGGGSSSGSDSGVTYEKASVDSVLGDFGAELAKNIKEGKWEEVGAAISEKLTEQLNSIKWDQIKTKAANFGTNLAKLINGLVTPELFSALGTTLGESINTALSFGKAIGDTLKWDRLGASIAAGINGFVKTNPLKLAVETFNTWAKGILDGLNAAVTGVSWSTIGQHIADAIGRIDAWNIMWKFGTLVTNLVNAVYAIVSNKETWSNIGQKIADGINGWSEGFDSSKVAKTVNAIANGIWTALGTAIANIKWGKIIDDIISFIGNLDIGTISLVAAFALAPATLNILKTVVPKLIAAPITALGGVSVGTVAVAATFAVAIGWKIGNKIYEAATGEKVEGGMVDQIKEVFSGFFGKDKIDFDLGEFIQFTFGESNPWNDFWGNIGEKLYDADQSIKEVEVKIGGKITETFTNAKAKFDEVKDKVATVMAEAKEKTVGALVSIKEKFEAIKNKTAELTANVKESAAGALETIKSGWNAISTKTADLVANVIESAPGVLDKVKNGWETIKTSTAELTAKVVGGAEDAIDKIKKKFKGLKGKKAKLKASLEDEVSKVVTKINKKIKTIEPSISIEGKLKGKLLSGLETVKAIFDDVKNKTISIKTTFEDAFTGAIKRAWNGIANGINSAISIINKIPGVKLSRVPTLAQGGYADRATNVIFGEAGGEAIIPLERNLGAINKIAKVMLNGMDEVSKYRYSASPEQMRFSGDGVISQNNKSMTHSGDNELIAEQNRLLAEQNRLLQQIASKDVTISSSEVFNATRQEARNYSNRTGNSPFLF